jgi:hypothetical protein
MAGDINQHLTMTVIYNHSPSADIGARGRPALLPGDIFYMA